LRTRAAEVDLTMYVGERSVARWEVRKAGSKGNDIAVRMAGGLGRGGSEDLLAWSEHPSLDGGRTNQGEALAV
jgi:hypothetical protein